MVSDIEKACEKFGVGTRDRIEFIESPYIELSFDSLTVGILCGIKASGRIAHLSHQEIEDFFGNSPIQGRSSQTPCIQVSTGKQSVVVEHLFEVGNQPSSIG